MKITREWNDVPALHAIVSDALIEIAADDLDLNVESSNGRGSYLENGYIEIRTERRRFRLELTEIL